MIFILNYLKPISTNNQPIETKKRVLMPSSELFEKEPTIRISKICQDFNIGLEELFNLFKNMTFISISIQNQE